MNFSYEGVQSAEWLETNGLGGYAGAAVCGANTRRYHGLLVAATHPPVGRVVLLSKLDEEVESGGVTYELSCNQYTGAVHPTGFRYIKEFKRELFPEWIYELPGKIKIKKTVAAIHDENTTIIIYEIIKAIKPFTMKWLPLVAARDFHSIGRSNENINTQAEMQNGTFHTKPYANSPALFISLPDAQLESNPVWFYNFEYAVEQFRGMDYTEDLFSPGKLSKGVKEGDRFGIIISDKNPGDRDAAVLFEKEKQRREETITGRHKHKLLKTLALAADQFIVKRTASSKSGSPVSGDGALTTIIAGYHWFSDWGRDTMIALPGLCISTGRYEDAKKILRAFAAHISEGMLPNRFPDYEGEAVEYNTADATLWYFIAIQKYLDATGDTAFVLTELLPGLKEIIDWHFRGTRYNIKADEDGLLHAGAGGQQLTWMDARIGTWVVTPRIGKPVEIQALWYNALKIFAALLRLNNQENDADIVEISAKKVKDNFLPLFWNADKQCLYDCISNDYKDDSVRPNQLFALSLPCSLIDDSDKALAIIKVVREKLYTPAGLRSLDPDHPDYKKYYGGDQWHRDAAYHQGTVWSWLLGPYVDALIKYDQNEGRQIAEETVTSFLYHLQQACTGSISEIFDATAPHIPRGCVAQAWGAGEILRILTDYKLYKHLKEIKPAFAAE